MKNMSNIDLLLDEENELTFQLNIEGNAPGDAKCRLRLENDGIGLLFEANSHEKGEVTVVLPPLSHVIREGNYDMTLEVVVDDKFFEPLTLTGSFEKSVRVTAETVIRKPKRKKTNVTTAPLKETNTPVVTVRNSKSGRKSTKTILESKPKTTSKKTTSVTDKDILELIEALSKKGK
tara:strand:+ start:192 stop:722 length:531 start_codon:yes stop_codon:yes gene_type:complete